jgi:predicted GNAT family N-acyltransferase
MLYANWIHGTEDISPARAVREQVFVKEQGYVPEDEFDAFDAMAWHVVALDDDVPVGTGRVYLNDGEFHIGRLCVLPEYRLMGIGDALLRLLLDRAMMAGASGVHVSAQTYIKDLYKKFGFEEVGEPYRQPSDTREHVDMYAARENINLPSGCGGSCEGCAGCGDDQAEEAAE